MEHVLLWEAVLDVGWVDGGAAVSEPVSVPVCWRGTFPLESRTRLVDGDARRERASSTC